MRRWLLALALSGWFAAGLSGCYRYVHNYAVRRGFPKLETPAGVARGTVETVRFYSPAIGRTNRYMVYLPPGYAAAAADGRRFGVMYLLHGSPGAMSAFTNIDAVDVRMNTLIARRAVRPMILVMPAGEQGLGGDTEWANTASGRWMDFVMNVVHDVDRRFATLADRRHRAIAGASEGAYGALNIGLRDLRAFSVIESWSGYYTQDAVGPFSHASRAELAANSPAAYVPSLAPAIRRLGLRAWLLEGQEDWRSPGLMTRFAAELHAAGADVRYGFFPGGHDWRLWRAQTPRLLIAAGRWFGQRPGTHAGFGHVGRALSRAARLRIRRRECLALNPRRHPNIHPACRAYRAAHGLPTNAGRPGRARRGRSAGPPPRGARTRSRAARTRPR
jgi:enterochelin esterase-like enzyme